MEKKKILFVYDSMMIGGTTTSLISLLKAMPEDKYDIDLLLYLNEGEFLHQIPERINLLQPAFSSTQKVSTLRKIAFSFLNGQLFRYFGIVKRKGIQSKSGKRSVLAQLSVKAQVTLSRKIEKEYDVAVGFMELWADAFVASNKVCAAKKIAWVHVDYPQSGLVAEIDQAIWPSFQNIALVSEKCLQGFAKTFVDQKEKCIVIKNILMQESVRNRAKGKADIKIEKQKINFVTVCRIDFQHKGLDRALRAIVRIFQELNNALFHWYVIGDGPDSEAMKQFIQKESLESYVTMMGAYNNPLIIEKEFDAFFLPSRYEGKPMAVTEALMLGLPCFVTEYASAKEQIVDGHDGYVFENSDEGVYKAISFMIDNPTEIRRMKKEILNCEYSEIDSIYTVMRLLDSKG